MRAGGHSSKESAFTELYEATVPELRAFARRRVIDASSADDVVADTYLVAWRRFDDVPDDVKAALRWLYRAALYTVLNDRRSDRRRRALIERIEARDHGESSSSPADHTDDDEILREAFATLSEDDRRVLLLAAWEGLSGAELGEVLGCSEAAAWARLSRARSRLTAALRAAESDRPAGGDDGPV